MWILSKQGKELFNLDEITNLYIVDAGGVPERRGPGKLQPQD